VPLSLLGIIGIDSKNIFFLEAGEEIFALGMTANILMA
jgi:hypothetical protein